MYCTITAGYGMDVQTLTLTHLHICRYRYHLLEIQNMILTLSSGALRSGHTSTSTHRLLWGNVSFTIYWFKDRLRCSCTVRNGMVLDGMLRPTDAPNIVSYIEGLCLTGFQWMFINHVDGEPYERTMRAVSHLLDWDPLWDLADLRKP